MNRSLDPADKEVAGGIYNWACGPLFGPNGELIQNIFSFLFSETR